MPDTPDTRTDLADVSAEAPQVRFLNARITPEAGGWDIRVPLRRETVGVEKRVVVVEEVVVRRRKDTQTQRIQATTRRERLRIDTFGQTEPPDVTVRRPGRRRRS